MGDIEGVPVPPPFPLRPGGYATPSQVLTQWLILAASLKSKVGKDKDSPVRFDTLFAFAPQHA